MSFNQLPDHAVIRILNHLDQDSKFRAMIVFERWAEVFASSPKLIDGFVLKLNGRFLKCKIDDFPKIPIHEVLLYDGRPWVLQILRKYEMSIKSIEIQGDVRFEDLAVILRLKNLEHLKLNDVKINEPPGFFMNNSHDGEPTIKSLHINAHHSKVPAMFNLFKHGTSIEKLSLSYYTYDENKKTWGSKVDAHSLNKFVKTFPNLKHMVIRNDGFRYYEEILNQHFPVKLQKLEVSALDCSGDDIPFLRTQKDSLQVLIVHDDYTTDKNLMFIANEMKLEYFKYGEKEMIVNYERQPAFLKKPKK